jgi:hypothetical protein
MGNILFGDYVYVSMNLKFMVQLLDLKLYETSLTTYYNLSSLNKLPLPLGFV